MRLLNGFWVVFGRRGGDQVVRGGRKMEGEGTGIEWDGRKDLPSPS